MIISKRHKRTALRTRVVRRIEEFSKEEWDKIFPDVLEGYDFFRALDESNLGQFSFYYIMVYNRKTPVGATVCFSMDYSLDTSISGSLRRLSNSIKKFKPNIFSLKVLVCGMPMGQGRIGIAGDNNEMVIKVILRRMEQIAKKIRAPIVAFKDFDKSYTSMLDPLQNKGFAKLDSLPSTEMNIWFNNFEEYLKTLSSASRYDLRRKFKKVDGSVKIDMEISNSLDAGGLSDVYRLYLQMLDKHEMGFEVLPIEFFKNISKHMPEHAKFFLWRIDGKLAAFLLCLVSENILIDYYVGLDYAVAHKYHLYFLKFRDVLNWCIKKGIKKYEMGITGYEPKRRFGFDFVPLYIYAKLRNMALRPVFKLICQFLKFENFDPALRKAKMNKAASG